MQYLYPNRYRDFWLMLKEMVVENYETDEMQNHVLVFGDYIFRSAKDIKYEFRDFCDKLIVYQLEPLVLNHHWNMNHIINNIRDADEVWDYDLQNVEILLDHGINAKFKPMKYTHSLKRIPENNNPDIDVLFFGNFSSYRNKIIAWLYAATDPRLFSKMNFVWLNHFLDSKLDDFISRSKIILNINPYSGQTRQQQTRIFYPLINNKCVVSQNSEINYFGDSIYQFSDHHSLNKVLLNLLENDMWKHRSPNFNRCFSFDSHKIAIFYHINYQNNWKINHENILKQLQHFVWFDHSDYMHFGKNNFTELPYNLLKVNRTFECEDENHTLREMIKFCKMNPDYKILYIENDQPLDIENDFNFYQTKNQLDKIDLIYPNSEHRHFAATASYINTLDSEILMSHINDYQYSNWLRRII